MSRKSTSYSKPNVVSIRFIVLLLLACLLSLFASAFVVSPTSAYAATGVTVYIDGSSGSDTNDGTSATTPVKTFDVALSKIGDANKTNENTILVLNTIEVSTTENWDASGYTQTTIKRDSSFTGNIVKVSSGGDLTLKNITFDGENTSGVSPLIAVEGTGKLTLNSGAVIQNNASSADGAGISCVGITSESSGPTLIMNAGSKVTNNGSGSGSGHGGGVYLCNNATFSFNGGEISNNKAYRGGGVCLAGKSSMTMEEGSSISGNVTHDASSSATQEGYGGGILITDTDGGGINGDVSFIMNGGTISGNTGMRYGGGICTLAVDGSSSTNKLNVTINGGTISKNTVGYNSSNGTTIFGAGISLNHSATVFRMTGGQISENELPGTSLAYGGGICLAGVTDAQITGGTISSNTATKGGGICIGVGNISGSQGTGNIDFTPASKLSVTNATIKDNVAHREGGGIALYEGKQSASTSTWTGSQVNLTNTTITKNTASTYNANTGEWYSVGQGGGIFLSGSSVARLYGTTKISENKAGDRLTVNGLANGESFSNGIFASSGQIQIYSANLSIGEDDDFAWVPSNAYVFVLTKDYSAAGPIALTTVKTSSSSSSFYEANYTVEESSVTGTMLTYFYPNGTNTAADMQQAAQDAVDNKQFVASDAMCEVNPTLFITRSNRLAVSSSGTYYYPILTYGGTPQHTVTYNSVVQVKTGETTSRVNDTVIGSTTVRENPFTAEAGYDLVGTRELIGWNTKQDGSGTTYLPGEDLEVTADITLYALWDSYTVTYKTGDNYTNNLIEPIESKTFTYRYGDVAYVYDWFDLFGYYTSTSRIFDNTWTSDKTIKSGPLSSTRYWSVRKSFTVVQDIVFTPGTTASSSSGMLTYKAGEGTGTDVTLTCRRNTTCILQSAEDLGFTAPANKPYFVGWKGDGITRDDAPTTASEPYPAGTAYKLTYTFSSGVYSNTDHTLTAVWSDVPPTMYTLHYDANGGTGTVPDDKSYAPSVSITLAGLADGAGSTILTKDGYYLSGWNEAADGSGTHYDAYASITLDADKTLYAEWTPVYRITYDPNSAYGGKLKDGVSALTDNKDYKTGEKARVLDAEGVYENPIAYTSNYRTFTGWNTKPDGTGYAYAPGDVITLGSENLVLYAQWTNEPDGQKPSDPNTPDSGGTTDQAADASSEEGTTPATGDALGMTSIVFLVGCAVASIAALTIRKFIYCRRK